MRHRIFSRSLFALALAAAATGLAAQDRIEAEIVERLQARLIPVRIEAGAPNLQQLATRAFSAHGAFRVDNAAPNYTLRFTATGGAQVHVSVETGRPARVVFSQDASGTSASNALLRAADAAVTHLTKLPGFFSGRLAFVSERTGRSEIYVSDLFFTETVQLTHDGSQAVTPRWSPDGRRILYTSYFRNGFPDIYLIDTATSQRVPFVSTKGTNTGGRFSPDGSRVAMVLSGEGNPEVYVSNAQGRGIRRLTRTERQIEATPSWSPDGARLVVASDALATGKPQLYLLGAGGGAMQRLPANLSGYCAEPDWSHANRDLIAFTAASGNGYQVAVYSFSAGSARFVTRGPGDCIEPSWTNDGRHLLYTSRSAGSQRIFLLDTESGRATLLSTPGVGKAYQANFVKR